MSLTKTHYTLSLEYMLFRIVSIEFRLTCKGQLNEHIGMIEN